MWLYQPTRTESPNRLSQSLSLGFLYMAGNQSIQSNPIQSAPFPKPFLDFLLTSKEINLANGCFLSLTPSVEILTSTPLPERVTLRSGRSPASTRVLSILPTGRTLAAAKSQSFGFA